MPTIEEHYSDLAQATYACDTTGSVTPLNLIAEGNDNVNRLGRKALMKQVCVRGYALPTSNAQIGAQGRVLLVWDNAANGALPVITDIYTAITSSSFLNVNNVARFSILAEHPFELGYFNSTATQTAADQSIKRIDIRINLNSITEFSGTTAAIASIQNGALLLVTMGSTAAATGITATLSTRVTFVDVL